MPTLSFDGGLELLNRLKLVCSDILICKIGAFAWHLQVVRSLWYDCSPERMYLIARPSCRSPAVAQFSSNSPFVWFQIRIQLLSYHFRSFYEFWGTQRNFVAYVRFCAWLTHGCWRSKILFFWILIFLKGKVLSIAWRLFLLRDRGSFQVQA
jgi:hypothetical protein